MGKEVHCYSVPDYASAALAAAVEDIFAQSAAARALGPRSRVLVKPNLVAKHAPEKAVTTHPAVLDAVCAALRRRGVESITVADSPGGLYNPAVMKSIYKASGLLAVCERHGALAYTACEAAPRKTDGVRVKEFSLLRPVLEADFIIDLPKVKTHVMTGMSCAVKNLFGTVPGLQKAEFHMRFPEKEPFGEMLVDLCETVRPQLIIADGVLAMEGDGPAGGTPRALRWAVPGVEKWLAPRPKIYRSKCIGCGKCAEICPGHTITVEDGKAHIVPRACIRCFCCHEMCPAKAIDVKRAGIFNL